MTCCGKAKSIIRQGGRIAQGFTNLAAGRKCPQTDARIRTCHKCDEQTWMSKKQYAGWLQSHGLVLVLKSLDDLTGLPKLPKQEQARGRRNLFCRICKCFIPAKARVQSEKCPLGKWPG
ncbi:MAG TPA: hypothetical protein HPP51_05525 [Planctomycetes bacterium]|nr:hypothetical protein [Planctomycetota bacterium]